MLRILHAFISFNPHNNLIRSTILPSFYRQANSSSEDTQHVSTVARTETLICLTLKPCPWSHHVASGQHPCQSLQTYQPVLPRSHPSLPLHRAMKGTVNLNFDHLTPMPETSQGSLNSPTWLNKSLLTGQCTFTDSIPANSSLFSAHEDSATIPGKCHIFPYLLQLM